MLSGSQAFSISDSVLCLLPVQYTLYSSKRQKFPALRKSRNGPKKIFHESARKVLDPLQVKKWMLSHSPYKACSYLHI